MEPQRLHKHWKTEGTTDLPLRAAYHHPPGELSPPAGLFPSSRMFPEAWTMQSSWRFHSSRRLRSISLGFTS